MPDERLRIKIEADAERAEQELRTLADLGEELTDDDLTIVVDAKTDAARAELKRLTSLLAQTDDATDIKVVLSGIQTARREIQGLEDLGRRSEVTVPVEADTSGFKAGLGDLGDAAGDLAGQLGPIGSILSTGPAAPAAAAVAIGTALFAAADSAADTAVEVKQMSDLLGGSVEDASRLKSAFGAVGIEASDLMDIVLQTTGALDSQPALVQELGLAMGGTPIENFIEAADAVEGIEDANRKAIISAQLFGEEGVRQLQALKSQYGSVKAAIEAVPELAVLGEDDIEQAITYQKEMAELKTTFGALAAELGRKVLPVVTQIVDKMNKADEGEWGKFFRGLGHDISTGIGFVQRGLIGDYFSQEIEDAKGVTAEDAADLGVFIGDTFAEGMRRTSGELGSELTAGLSDVDTAKLEAAALLGEQAMGGLDLGIEEVTLSVEEQKAAFEEALIPLQNFNEEVANSVTALEEQAAAHDAAAAAAKEHLGLFKTYADAVIDRVDAEADLAETMKDEKATMEDRRDAVIKVAAAFAEEKRLAREASGEVASQTSQVDEMNWQLLNLAGTLDGPTQQAMGNYIANLNGIPESTATEIIALINEGKLDEANALLAEASTSRDVALVADAETKDAQDALDDVASAEYVAYMELGAITEPAERKVDDFEGDTERRDPKVPVGADDAAGRTTVSDFVSDIDGSAATLTVKTNDAEIDALERKIEALQRTVYVNVAATGLERFTTNVANAINSALGGGRTTQSQAARYVWRNGRYVEVS